ncbi:MAG: hypothetical protein JNL41_09985 [Phenylobacterium sp.]|uniref:macro domain-containing protein n=1 Tax=Phenylobacterium sp. TaxID=1871053 RepID=UPI001A61316F|nr:macro domain-containing protein [Phenylobacterium sp.]MBL8554595.1 hypothetical protein [Phenylobacterium sp.]
MFRYFFRSICTFSFWRYALFSAEALGKLLATIGAIYLFMELMDFLSIYTKDRYSSFAIIPIIAVAVLFVVVTRRPVARVSYKAPHRDYRFEVKIGDIFAENADVVISTNTTFDTDMASGLIAVDSLQGQLAIQVFQGNTDEIDRQLAEGLRQHPHVIRADAKGKKEEFPIGTVAKVTAPGRIYYFVAMSRLNEHGTARSTLHDIDDALEGLWKFVGDQGELRPIAIPLMGTGRGRVELPRKKMIERIAQSFADASRDKIFSNRLAILVRPQDAENFGVNLFEVRDYLVRSLHT